MKASGSWKAGRHLEGWRENLGKWADEASDKQARTERARASSEQADGRAHHNAEKQAAGGMVARQARGQAKAARSTGVGV